MGVFPQLPLFPLFFDGTKSQHDRKNSFVKVRCQQLSLSLCVAFAAFAVIAVFFDGVYRAQ